MLAVRSRRAFEAKRAQNGQAMIEPTFSTRVLLVLRVRARE
jgi:hypothetical protein